MGDELDDNVNQEFHGDNVIRFPGPFNRRWMDCGPGWTATPAAQITGYHISLERPQCSILSE